MKINQKTLRGIAGLLSLVALLAMMIYSLDKPNITIPKRTFTTLLLLITAGLGIDVLAERRKLLTSMLQGAIEAYVNQQSSNSEDGNE